MRLFLVKDNSAIKIELKQQDDILFNLVTKAGLNIRIAFRSITN